MPLRRARVGRVGVIGHPVAKTAVVAKAVTPGPAPVAKTAAMTANRQYRRIPYGGVERVMPELTGERAGANERLVVMLSAPRKRHLDCYVRRKRNRCHPNAALHRQIRHMRRCRPCRFGLAQKACGPAGFSFR